MMKKREKSNKMQKMWLERNLNLSSKLVATFKNTTIPIEARSDDAFPLHTFFTNLQREKNIAKNS